MEESASILTLKPRAGKGVGSESQEGKMARSNGLRGGVVGSVKDSRRGPEKRKSSKVDQTSHNEEAKNWSRENGKEKNKTTILRRKHELTDRLREGTVGSKKLRRGTLEKDFVRADGGSP